MKTGKKGKPHEFVSATSGPDYTRGAANTAICRTHVVNVNYEKKTYWRSNFIATIMTRLIRRKNMYRHCKKNIAIGKLMLTRHWTGSRENSYSIGLFYEGRWWKIAWRAVRRYCTVCKDI